MKRYEVIEPIFQGSQLQGVGTILTLSEKQARYIGHALKDHEAIEAVVDQEFVPEPEPTPAKINRKTASDGERN